MLLDRRASQIASNWNSLHVRKAHRAGQKLGKGLWKDRYPIMRARCNLLFLSVGLAALDCGARSTMSFRILAWKTGPFSRGSTIYGPAVPLEDLISRHGRIKIRNFVFPSVKVH